MIPLKTTQIMKTITQRLYPITITTPAWNKFHDILTGVSNAETIKLDTTQIDYCSCIERRHQNTSSDTYQRKLSIYKPILSVITQPELNKMYAEDKRYPPTVLINDGVSIVIPSHAIDVLNTININYFPTDYSIGIINRGFTFTSKNENHDFCPCGNLIIKL